jgi:hypothetical protein
VRWQLRQLGSDLIERQTDPLCEDNERNASQDRSRIAALAGTLPLGRDEATLLVETERGSRHSAATRYFADQEQIVHAVNVSREGLDFKFT